MIARGSAIAGAPPSSRARLGRKPEPEAFPPPPPPAGRPLFTRPQLANHISTPHECASAASTPAPAARINIASAVAAVLVGALSLIAAQPPPPATAAAADAPSIASIFTGKCAGCHAGGGNILLASATLRTEDLERNGYASPEALYALIYGGKGRMPGYGADCAPRGACTFGARLADDEVKGVADYVLRRAGEGWAAEAAP
jgi:cytochrome c6